VTERSFEKSGFSFVITGANKNKNTRIIKNANEKFNFAFSLRSLFRKININGSIKMNSITDKEASTKLKFKKINAEENSEKSIPKKSKINEV
jgi:hypothetical protein